LEIFMITARPPEYWAREASLEQIEDEVRAIDAWQERDAEFLDFAYQERVMRALGKTRASSRDEAVELAEHLGRVAHDSQRAALDALARPYFSRWRVLAELVHRSALHLDVPETVLGRKHVTPILLRLHARGGEVAQADLGDLVANEGQRSALLKFMEGWDLVERTPGASGHTRTVAITDLGRLAIADQVPAAAAAAPTMKRGVEVFGRAVA
jgi:hypothetical protein